MAFNFGAAALGFSRVLEDTKDRNLKKKLVEKKFQDDIKKIMLKSELDKGTQEASERREMREQSKLLLQYLDPDVAKNIIGTGSLAAIKNAVEVAEKARANGERPTDIIKLYNPGGIDTSGITEGNIKQASRAYLSEKLEDENLASPTERKMYAGYEPDRVGYFPSNKKEKKPATNFATPIIAIVTKQQEYLNEGGSTEDETYKKLERQKQQFVDTAKDLKKTNPSGFKGFTPSSLSSLYSKELSIGLGENARIDNVGNLIKVSVEGNRPAIAVKYLGLFNSFKNNFKSLATDSTTQSVDDIYKSFIAAQADKVNRDIQETINTAIIPTDAKGVNKRSFDTIEDAETFLANVLVPTVVLVNGNRLLWSGEDFIKPADGVQ